MFVNTHLTTSLIWMCTGVVAILDGILILLTRRLVNRSQFHKMRWLLVVISGVFFLLVWIFVMGWG
jgi:hypothetical membrane protein